MTIERMQMGEILLSSGMITDEQHKEVLEKQKTTKQSLTHILLDNKLITRNNIKDALELNYGIGYVHAKDIALPTDILKLFPTDYFFEQISGRIPPSLEGSLACYLTLSGHFAYTVDTDTYTIVY